MTEVKRCPKCGAIMDIDGDDVPDINGEMMVIWYCEECGYEEEEIIKVGDEWWEDEKV